MQLHQLDARIRKMKEDIRAYRVREAVPVAHMLTAPRGSQDFVPFENGDYWGVTAEDNWRDFKFTVVIPEGFFGRAVLRVQTGREGQWEATHPQMVVWVNGRIEQSFDTQHTEMTLANPAKPGERYEIFVQAYANTPEGQKAKPVPYLEMSILDVMEDVSQLYYDLDVPYEALMMLPEDSREREVSLRTLSDAINLVDLRKPFSEEFFASIAAARAYLAENFYAPLRDHMPEAIADCVGHTHIDVAWLWDLEQTRHKAVRTFATMLKLMEEYPEFKFMSSQAQLYQFVKEDQPELFERIRQAVQDGRWEAEGGMWVEADCNLSGGEALVRQFLYGNEFFERELGKRSRILWLPDVFGYSAALPQILKKSGIDYFMTSKLSWSEFNKSPYDTFLWKGIDGSEVLTHFTPSRSYVSADQRESHIDLPYFTTYNAMLEPREIKGGWQRFQQKGIDGHFLVSYGYGDGGGGSTDWMIENARRMTAPVGGCPAVRHTFARDFFEALDKRVSNHPALPKWSGELYLEYHRGTYTAQGKNKRNNRKIEIALREAELWSSYAEKACGIPYPAEEIDGIWRRMLTLQFHDILPGSSIHKVYTDSDEIYADLFEKLTALTAPRMEALAKGIAGDIVLFNALSCTRDDVVWFDAPEGVTALLSHTGEEYAAQYVEGRYVAYVRNLAPMSATGFAFVYGEAASPRVHLSATAFETPVFRGAFDANMGIISLVDKRTGREMVKPGEALNRLVCYENRPHNYDAWDINIYYNEHAWPVDELLSCEVIASGAVMAALRVSYKTGDSTVTQDMRFYTDIDRIDFVTKIDWHEPHGLLKAHFPVDVFYNEAQFDIQYGNVRRATHTNTSWDVARFEVCAHKWMDVSEPNYGFSLMNDCKYGHSVNEKGIALTLVKGSTEPDPTADIGLHHFTYAICPHCGDWRTANTPKMAYELNIPVIALPGGQEGGALPPFAASDRENVIIECVKQALKGEGTIIRLYECFGARTDVSIALPAGTRNVRLVSLMEDNQDELTLTEGKVSLTLKPYEIVSLRVNG